MKISSGRIYIANKEISLKDLEEKISDTNYIIQEKVQNHPIIDTIYPYSINTLRIVTVLLNGEVEHYATCFRTGMNGSYVDNACAGGFLMNVEQDGTITPWGIVETQNNGNAIVYEKHPDTRTNFANQIIPFYEDAVRMAKQFHSLFYGIPSMGWDVAITKDGPVFLEAGEDWEIQMHQFFDGGSRKKFYEYHKNALNIKLRNF